MRQHKFKVGQKVKFLPRAVSILSRAAEAASYESYEVTRLLPAEGFGFQYRIKGLTKGQERVATESEIA